MSKLVAKFESVKVTYYHEPRVQPLIAQLHQMLRILTLLSITVSLLCHVTELKYEEIVLKLDNQIWTLHTALDRNLFAIGPCSVAYWIRPQDIQILQDGGDFFLRLAENQNRPDNSCVLPFVNIDEFLTSLTKDS